MRRRPARFAGSGLKASNFLNFLNFRGIRSGRMFARLKAAISVAERPSMSRRRGKHASHAAYQIEMD
jgi:hypothetical protein